MADDSVRGDSDEYVVTAPYITPKVKDPLGVLQVRGYNEGGVIRGEDIDPASLRHHLESGLLAAKGTPAAEYAVPAGSPKPGEPPNVPVSEQPPVSMQDRAERVRDATGQGRPHVNAPKSDWVDWAVAHRPPGVSEQDARVDAEAKSKADLVAGR
jgi:hypothetical protein